MIKGWGKFWNSLRLKNGRGFAILMFTRKGDTKALILTFFPLFSTSYCLTRKASGWTMKLANLQPLRYPGF